ncbi:helix-turn-helix domain-containing protein [Clavibacter michiganensis]|uniref:helix-turn-helix domain-containing protein n=1 Tax=Clavibacter michiganensis TaxID=28447 RepID=UPI001BE00A32|nr:hypothetical protein [Clavibacter michiganensis]MBT1634364.1 hypothetical protein [Clavibacter michiganensis]
MNQLGLERRISNMTYQPESYFEEFEHDPRGRAELSLTRFEDRIHVLLRSAFAARVDISSEDLGNAMGVPTSRVQDLLNGEDVLRAEAFIRYASLLGYVPQIELHAVSDEAPDLQMPASPAPGQVRDNYEHVVVDDYGARSAKVAVTYYEKQVAGTPSIEHLAYRGSDVGESVATPKDSPWGGLSHVKSQNYRLVAADA